MKLPRRPILLALLALAAPMSALAVSGNDGPQALSVSASLAGCGTSSNQVVCELNVSFNQLDNADSYTASVTRADGSVVDYGSVPAGGTSLFVPYVGSGSYTVTITAYGDPEGEGEPKEVAKETSQAADDDKEESEGEAQLEGAPTEGANGGEQEKPAEIAPAGGDEPAAEACVEQPAPTVPPEPPAPPADTDPANPDEDADGIDDATEVTEYERLVAEREQALQAAEQAAASDCP